ncbi:arylsulfatase [Gimesia fumaroli]|uniref:Arylsulfatase n=1 Tax=Gimesia fumaroli TaxID=2527976 RepID=A0A518IKN3_9PLAN|nr:arylsulfatase [Gimesia fumaroli]QDV53637.1 Arylsulfatase [Gimesia fumaroli]
MLNLKVLFSVTFVLFFLVTTRVNAVEEMRPNIILIMVDDMGFSDLGCYGGEIETPNLDALAAGGVRFSQFYNTARCCPTRATLMTGLHPHQTGIGWMTNPPGNTRGETKPPSYQGYLNRQCVTIAEVLQSAGYATYMTGKWHLGFNAKDRWPLQRGFEKYFGCISGATRFFYPEEPRGMTLGNEHIKTPPSTTDRRFYTTDAFTDYAIHFLKEHQQNSTQQEKPFFLYLAYTAPHWPLQAHEEEIKKYRGKYRIGWDELRKQRLAKQKKLGLLPADTKLSPRNEAAPAWDSLDKQKQNEMDLKMSVYAAMVDRMDQNIGKLVDWLKANQQYDNTLILFLSDNGACAEGPALGRGRFMNPKNRDQEHSNSYGKAWANASNTPFRLFKHYAHEGGTSTPFLMHWPAQIQPRKEWYTEPAQLIDIMPTLVDVAGAKYPKTYAGNEIHALDGVSLRPAMQGKRLNRAAPLFIEHESNAFVRDGDWKLVGRGVSPAKGFQPQKWELYDVKQDRTELNNLAKEKPEMVSDLSAQWQAWAKRVGVYPK